jgi:hypothetical protein
MPMDRELVEHYCSRFVGYGALQYCSRFVGYGALSAWRREEAWICQQSTNG